MGIFRDKHFHTHHNHTVAAAYPQTIHEHKAPTDESVKILREMEGAARESVLSVHKFEDNELNGIVVQMMMDHFKPYSKLYIRFTLNGKKFAFTEKLDDVGFAINREKAACALMEGVREAIFENLLPEIGKALTQRARQ